MITFEEYENALKQRHGERIYNILSHSSVAIAGLGGLGSNIAMYLARAFYFANNIYNIGSQNSQSEYSQMIQKF